MTKIKKKLDDGKDKRKNKIKTKKITTKKN